MVAVVHKFMDHKLVYFVFFLYIFAPEKMYVTIKKDIPP